MYVARGTQFYSWVPSSTGPGTLTLLFTFNGNLLQQYNPTWVPCCFDSTRRRVVFIGNEAPEGAQVASTYMFADLKNLSLGMQAAPISGASKPRLDGSRASSSLTYIPPLPGGRGDYYLWFTRGMSNLLDPRQPNQNYPIMINPVTWAASDLIVSTSLSNAPTDATAGTWNRFMFVPELNVVAYINADGSGAGDYGVYVFRVA